MRRRACAPPPGGRAVPAIRGVGKLPEPEQVAGLFEIGVVGEFVDVDAAIRENSPFAIDVADLGVGSNNSFQSLRGLICGDTPGMSSRFFRERVAHRASERRGGQPFLIPETLAVSKGRPKVSAFIRIEASQTFLLVSRGPLGDESHPRSRLQTAADSRADIPFAIAVFRGVSLKGLLHAGHLKDPSALHISSWKEPPK